MEIQSDHHGLLVVSLDNCITSVGATPCNLGKADSCVYAGSEAPMVQISGPFGDIRQSIPRLQPQHLSPLQSIQYSQAVSYEPSQTLYQPMTVTTTSLPLQHYSTSPYQTSTPQTESNYLAEGFDYFMEIQNYLISQQYPTNTSQSYNKSLKKRAQNYLMIDGKLYHNRKLPKEVVMRKDQQEDLLSDVHVVKENAEGSAYSRLENTVLYQFYHYLGVHLGVKKMFSKLHTSYFWRGMYTDVVHFVRKCDKCWEQVTVPHTIHGGESDDSEAVEDPLPLSPSPFHPATRVWSKVEVQVHGPYHKTCSRNEFVLTMTCPESGWCCARAVPASGLPTHLADFVFHSFCNYGFARCFLIGCSSDLQEAVSSEYSIRAGRLGDVFSNARLESVEPEQSSTTWVQPLILRLVEHYNNKWDKHLDHFLFQYRIGELKDLTPHLTTSPFSILFSHDPVGFTTSDQDKENVNKSNSGYHLRHRKPSSTVLQCKYCSSAFTSKISFRIHQRRHIGESEHRKKLSNKKRSTKPKNGVESLPTQSDVKLCDKLRESSVTAVKALLEATKEERRRRGKYHKYPVELQEQMAAYAVKYGLSQSVKYFSETLGKPVGETTIRNMVKIHSAFTPTIKEEIGKFAAMYGVEPAAKSYSEWLKRDVSLNLVRKFKTIHLSKRPEHLKQQRERQSQLSKIKSNNELPFKNKKLSAKVKDEIGEYACTHSVQDTAEYFTEKLKIPIRERTVKRVYKSYLDKCCCKSRIEAMNQETQTQVLEPPSCVNQETTHVNVYNSFQEVRTVPVTFYQLNQFPSSNNSVCYQASSSSSVITSQSGGPFSYQTVQSFPSTLPSLSIPVPPPPSYPVTVMKAQEKMSGSNFTVAQQNQQTQTCLIPQQPVFITQDRTGPLFSHFMTTQPIQQTILTIIPDKEALKLNDNQDLSSNIANENYQEEHIPDDVEAITVQIKEEEALPVTEEIEVPVVVKGTKPYIRTDVGSKKRGTYTVYSPEIRAEIGKYAAEQGIVKACQHFANLLGHEVPESTARGLREKYLKKKKHCQVTSLGYSPRGRPLRLGKYDELVQHCLKDLVRSGEKVSSYLAIMTAKQVLRQHEPSLLEENGGPLKLNTTWAKSILKRIGVHNNS